MRTTIVLLVSALALSVVPASLSAFPACDSFGQDWEINLGPFGTSFPGSLVVTGCRDCDLDLGCTGQLPLGGLVTITSGPTGTLLVFSMTAFDDPADADACNATNWNGKISSGTSVQGVVANESGPFGSFSLELGATCPAGPQGLSDPSRGN